MKLKCFNDGKFVIPISWPKELLKESVHQHLICEVWIPDLITELLSRQSITTGKC